MAIKWSAPEAILEGMMSTKSDVYSFGVVINEVCSFGRKPFHDLTDEEAIEEITSGNPEQPPPLSPDWIIDIQHACVALQPENRPFFGDVLAALLGVKESLDNCA